MSVKPVQRLAELGQSIWLDYIRRDMITRGELERLITQDGLRGMTSNPAIFEKAISGSAEYDDDIRTLAREGRSPSEIYEALSLGDVGSAADVFRPLYDRTNGLDGYVSMEVNPHLAKDTEGTVEEAHRFWKRLNRPNIYIKVPATEEGVPAIRRLIADGINVNVTLLFGLKRYREVAEAYVDGLAERASQGKAIHHVFSVASFFLSRIDSLVDPLFEKQMSEGGERAREAEKVRGQVAIASAKAAYQVYKEVFGGERFRKLQDQSAQAQRLLWASTSVKNPEYSDIKYVEALIGDQTVNTLPVETFQAYQDHGEPQVRIEDDLEIAHWVLDRAPSFGIDLDQVAQQLEDEGVEKFNAPFDQLMDSLSQKITLSG